MRRRHRHLRGSATVEFVLIVPVVIVLIAAITYFYRGYVTDFQTLHDAETQTWKVAMSNDRGVCGTSQRHQFASVELGEAGDAARELAAQTMPQFSFLFVNGGVRKSRTRAIPTALAPLEGRWTSTTRADYLPCNETVGANDAQLPGAFDALWLEYVSP
jgi:TadE-like protein